MPSIQRSGVVVLDEVTQEERSRRAMKEDDLAEDATRYDPLVDDAGPCVWRLVSEVGFETQVGALLRKSGRSVEPCRGIRRGPVPEEGVMERVGGDDMRYPPEGRDLRCDLELHGRVDEQIATGELYHRGPDRKRKPEEADWIALDRVDPLSDLPPSRAERHGLADRFVLRHVAPREREETEDATLLETRRRGRRLPRDAAGNGPPLWGRFASGDRDILRRIAPFMGLHGSCGFSALHRTFAGDDLVAELGNTRNPRLALDGVYVQQRDGSLCFEPLGDPTTEEIEQVARWTFERAQRVLGCRGRELDLEGRLHGHDDGEVELAQDQPVLASCLGASAHDQQLLGDAPGERTDKIRGLVSATPNGRPPSAG